MVKFCEKNVLADLGFSHVWNNQSTFNASALLTCIKTKLKERFISFWGLKINSTVGMDKLRTYRLILNSNLDLGNTNTSKYYQIENCVRP